jgi:hypothetical protein
MRPLRYFVVIYICQLVVQGIEEHSNTYSIILLIKIVDIAI